MQIKIFTIPVMAGEHDADELNHFLRANKIIDVRRELTHDNGNSCWTFCVSYMPDARTGGEGAERPSARQPKVDYKEVLDAAAFGRFAAMRKLRKELAERDAVPAYAVFTDAELAEIARLSPPLSVQALLAVPGIGRKKVEKYGQDFCTEALTESHEAGGTPDGAYS